jgi:hypothetical protein
MAYDPRELESALEATAAPVREQLATLDREIAEAEERLTKLRELRKRGRRVLGALGAEDHRTGPKAQPPTRKWKHDNPTSPETQQKVLDYVRGRFGPGVDITSPQIQNAPDRPMSHSVIVRALRDLHNSGELRLLRHGDGQHNRTKVYRLTEGGTDDTS